MSGIVEIDGSRISNFLHFQRDPLGFLVRVRDRGDVVSLYASKNKPSYVVNSPEYIREILVAKEVFFHKGRSTEILKRTLGEGLLTAEGTSHERQKKLMLPAFHKQRIEVYSDIIVSSGLHSLKNWTHGSHRNITTDMMELTLEGITRTMFGTSLGVAAQEVMQAVNQCVEYSAKRLFSPIPIPLGFPTPGNIKFRLAVRRLHDVLTPLIAKARRTDSLREDLLAMLAKAQDEETGQELSDQEIRDQLLTILIAGHETTANSLSWTWYLLSQNPEVEQKFHEELHTVLGDRTPAYSDLAQLTYTQHIFQESLRLYPAAWSILRESTNDVELCGNQFKKNSFFMMSPYAIHRNPEFFDEPERFWPERFAGDLLKRIPRFAYFPFGGGSRSCIGSNFALMEGVLLLATIGNRYKLRLLSNQSQILPEPLVSLRIRGGMQMELISKL